ncbi:MAG: GH3 auxin-responsive promoter family protein [Bacteroidia bacterium]|nr:GH3 auxin-responsive promoter family protein [Bacteroidia bacterium]MCZ2277990.1 GH3 auxin-responsive promoter family protein [Bacteroidia bacterium]
MPVLGTIIKSSIGLRHKMKIFRRSPEKLQKRELKKLLRKAQMTMFGEAYRFQEIASSSNFVKKFRAVVPVHDYNSIFAAWWNKCLHGKENVCWPGKVKYFALSSGTSESSSKHIPVTKEMVKAIQKASIRQILSLANFNLKKETFEKGILMLGGSTHLNQNGTYFEGDLSGITASQLPFWFQHFYKPGKNIARKKDWNEKLEEIVIKAKDWDIGVIVGVPAWIQLLLEKIIKHYGVKNIHEIWPNLSIYCHGGVRFEPYRKSFETLVGKPLVFIETYLASEGFIAFQDMPQANMRLILDNGIYYEFIPFTHENFTIDGDLIRKPKALTIEEVDEETEYALLLSTCSGAWRYLIGDTIRFTNKEKCEIVITGRTRHFLSLCGEHLSVDNMYKAVEMVSDDLNVKINEFTVTGLNYQGLFAHKWYIGTDTNINPDQIRTLLDEKLKILNDDYRVERTSALKELLLEVIPVNFFYDYLESKGKLGAQNKFPRVLKQDKAKEWDEYLEKRKSVQIT